MEEWGYDFYYHKETLWTTYGICELGTLSVVGAYRLYLQIYSLIKNSVSSVWNTQTYFSEELINDIWWRYMKFVRTYDAEYFSHELSTPTSLAKIHSS